MPEDNKKDILRGSIGNSFIALIPSKVKVFIVGGGRAAFIKTKSFASRGCKVVVISKKFNDKFEIFRGFSNVKFIEHEYVRDYIYEAHMVVIATNDKKLNGEIRRDCDRVNKLYMDCSEPEKGMYVMPCERDLKNFSIAVKVKGKSPKTSIYLAEKAKAYLEDYEEFADFTVKLRNKLKSDKKKKIMEFVCSDDFYFFYRMGKAELILKLFYGEGNEI
ncbi:NAD(P)-dependent oxidoreductase [Clostridium neuense]|uniref:precorrin-2 dehydrogenase n=1 Tax=Clostridium neuense TaxID=1728934 RepID=A0ABW8TIQ4_9CLOT